MFNQYNEELVGRDERRSFSRELWNESLRFSLKADSRETKDFLFRFTNLHQNLVNLSEQCDDNGVVFSLHAHLWGGVYPILKFADKEKIETLLPGLTSGKSVSCLVYTDSKDSPLICNTLPNGDFALNGKKKYITNAPVADLFIVYAKNNEQKMSAFIVKKGTQGMYVGENLNLSGLKTSTISNIEFQNCIVERKNLLGTEGNGAMIFNACIEKERLFIMSSILGRLHKLKKHYLEISKQNNLLEHYPNLETLAFVQNAILVSESILSGTVALLENGENVFLKSAQVKTIIVPLYQEVCRRIIQSLGGMGLEQDLGFERENRDALAASIYSGANELLNKLIATLSRN